MNIIFEKMGNKHQKQVMDIFNYYISNGTAAFPGTVLPEQFYRFLMEKSEGYPSYVLKKDNNSIIGFCQLSKYNPFSTFKSTANITYFISKDYTRKTKNYRKTGLKSRAGRHDEFRGSISASR